VPCLSGLVGGDGDRHDRFASGPGEHVGSRLLRRAGSPLESRGGGAGSEGGSDRSLFAAAWRSENLVRILDLTTGQIVREIRSVPLPMSTSFDPSGTRITIASQRDPTVVVDVRSGDEMLSSAKLGTLMPLGARTAR